MTCTMHIRVCKQSFAIILNVALVKILFVSGSKHTLLKSVISVT
jgi:hypothetical protein